MGWFHYRAGMSIHYRWKSERTCKYATPPIAVTFKFDGAPGVEVAGIVTETVATGPVPTEFVAVML